MKGMSIGLFSPIFKPLEGVGGELEQPQLTRDGAAEHVGVSGRSFAIRAVAWSKDGWPSSPRGLETGEHPLNRVPEGDERWQEVP